ncbi:hypothetical protein [Pseudomonas sp. FP2254]|uniref:hypothetical protein n=1 Tax=Pseudomonas sp. FP2254 TaxID=2954087 RepID=UPI002735A30F|nr:hypothetical protein [Pseudomonas sp. FP2254]WLH43250.1 hypothetical protein PSH94_11970 [Pseudomonas sp. FP2254]
MSAENKFITRWSRDFQGNLQEDPNGSWVLAADAALRDKRMMDKISSLQQRLTAADERNDEAIDLLRRARAVIAGGGWADLERDIAYLFKPAQPARCTNCDRATVEQCDDAGCGFLGAGNGAPE